MGRYMDTRGVPGSVNSSEEQLSGSKIIRSYSLLEEPPVTVKIVEDEAGRRFYYVEEPSHTENSRRIYSILFSKIQQSLKLMEEIAKLNDIILGLREFYKLALPLARGRFFSKQREEEAKKDALIAAYYLARDLIGYGVIDPLIRDPYIEDISCNGLNTPVFVYHVELEWLTTNIVFTDEAELTRTVMKLGLRSGREPSMAQPVVEGVLRPEGYRVHIVLDIVSRHGHSFTIRKFRVEPFTVVELIRRGTLNEAVAAFLWAAIQYKQGVVIYGPTGSGKTTLLNALAMLLPPEYKVVTVEDTPEIYIPFHENWTAIHTRLADTDGVTSITLQSQVESALRMRPDVIIVGEIRSREAYAFFQAVATGHGGLTTVHAEDVEVLIRRLSSPPMSVPKSLLSSAKLFTNILRLEREGTVQRRVIRVDEMRLYDVDRDEIILGSPQCRIELNAVLVVVYYTDVFVCNVFHYDVIL